MEPPLPPPELAEYVGSRTGDPIASYLQIGIAVRDALLELLDDDLTGKRLLDFGCGSGRVLRHLLDQHAEIHGCDIHGPSIEWMRRHLCPPLHAHLTGSEPPLPFPDDYFDVILAASVFTHLGESWARWMSELHRVLKPSGIAIVSILSAGYYEHMAGEPWDEDRVGMLVLGPGRPWEAGGPMTFVSPWWVRSHWERAFEIVRLDTEDFADVRSPDGSQGVVVMRARPVTVTAELLDAPEPDEPRELAAALHAVALLERDSIALSRQHDAYAAAYEQERAQVADLRAQVADLIAERDALQRALSMRRSSRVRALFSRSRPAR